MEGRVFLRKQNKTLEKAEMDYRISFQQTRDYFE